MLKWIALAAALILSGCGGTSAGPAVTQNINTQPPASQSPPPAPATTPPPPNCTIQTGSFQLVATGFTNNTVGMASYKYYPCDKLAQIFLPGLSGPSNATTFTAGPLPTFLVPATIAFQEHAINGFNNGVEQGPMSVELMAGSDVLTYSFHGNESGWTASGSKGTGLQVITVFLD